MLVLELYVKPVCVSQLLRCDTGSVVAIYEHRHGGKNTPPSVPSRSMMCPRWEADERQVDSSAVGAIDTDACANTQKWRGRADAGQACRVARLLALRWVRALFEH